MTLLASKDPFSRSFLRILGPLLCLFVLSELVWDKFDGLSSSSNRAKFVPFVHVLTSLVDSIEEDIFVDPKICHFF